MLYWIWNRRIVLPFYKNENSWDATKLSLIYLFEDGSNINTIFNYVGNPFVKNETLFNIMTRAQNSTMQQLQLLIDYKFDFEKLINIYDNIKLTNGLIQLTTEHNCYSSIKLLLDHCKTLKQCNIDITHCDINGQNALFHAALRDVKSLSYLLSNICFPNHDINNKNGQIALNQTNKSGSTIAHIAANNPTPHSVETFKLLKKYNFNFNIIDSYGKLPIHYICRQNNHLLLSWMIDEENSIGKDMINCETKQSRNKSLNGITPLSYAISYNSTECVSILCKQSDIEIGNKHVTKALAQDNVTILKLLICASFAKCKILTWDDIEKQNQNKNSIISSTAIKDMVNFCKNNKKQNCYSFLTKLYNNGYSVSNYNCIILHLRVGN